MYEQWVVVVQKVERDARLTRSKASKRTGDFKSYKYDLLSVCIPVAVIVVFGLYDPCQDTRELGLNAGCQKGL